MLGNDRIKTVSTEVTSIWRRNDIENSTWRTHLYFVDFESRIHVEISTSNQCHNFHVDSLFKINVISTNFPRGISTSNRWRINEDVCIGVFSHFIAKQGMIFKDICFKQVTQFCPPVVWFTMDLWTGSLEDRDHARIILLLFPTMKIFYVFFWMHWLWIFRKKLLRSGVRKSRGN